MNSLDVPTSNSIVGCKPLPCHPHIRRIQLNPQKTPIQAQRHDPRCPRPEGRIEDDSRLKTRPAPTRHPESHLHDRAKARRHVALADAWRRLLLRTARPHPRPPRDRRRFCRPAASAHESRTARPDRRLAQRFGIHREVGIPYGAEGNAPDAPLVPHQWSVR